MARRRPGVACRIVTSDREPGRPDQDVAAQMLTVDARRVILLGTGLFLLALPLIRKHTGEGRLG